MSETGKELQENNEQIVYFLNLLKNQRREIDFLIDKQEEEKNRLEMEIERIYYKLTLICKSLATRKKARVYYDQTIKELEEHYRKIVESSGVLLNSVKMGAGQLEQIMDKKIGTGSLDGDDRGSIIPGPPKDEVPTKDSTVARPNESPAPPDREDSPSSSRPQKKKKAPPASQPPPIQEVPSKEKAQSEPASTSTMPEVASAGMAAPSDVPSTSTSQPPSVASTSKKESFASNSKKESVASSIKKESVASSIKKESVASSMKKESVASSAKDSMATGSVTEKKSEENKGEPNKKSSSGASTVPRAVSSQGEEDGNETYLVVDKFQESEDDTLFEQDSLDEDKKSKHSSMVSVSSHSLSGQNDDEPKIKKKTRVSRTEVTGKKQVEHEFLVRVDPHTTADTEDVVVLKKPGGRSNSGLSIENATIFDKKSPGGKKPPPHGADHALKSAFKDKVNASTYVAEEEEDEDTDSEDVPVTKFGKMKGGSARHVRRLNSGDN